MRYRLSPLARLDVEAIRDASRASFGTDAWLRYRGLSAAAMRRAAAEPGGRATVDSSVLARGLRCLHIRHARGQSREGPVRSPVHVIYYRVVAPRLIEIVRVLHERMDPARHVGTKREDPT